MRATVARESCWHTSTWGTIRLGLSKHVAMRAQDYMCDPPRAPRRPCPRRALRTADERASGSSLRSSVQEPLFGKTFRTTGPTRGVHCDAARRRGDARDASRKPRCENRETTSRRASSGERDRQPEMPVHRGPCGPCFADPRGPVLFYLVTGVRRGVARVRRGVCGSNRRLRN